MDIDQWGAGRQADDLNAATAEEHMRRIDDTMT